MYPAENQVYPLIAEAAASCDTKLNLPADEIQGQEQMVSLSLDFPFSSPLYGDNVFEKHGINRDRTGDREKTRYLCGKQGIFTRDRALIRLGFIRQLETRASTRSASFFHALASPGRAYNGGGAAGHIYWQRAENPVNRPFLGAKRATQPVPEVTAADKEDGLSGPWSQYSRDGTGGQAGEPCKRGVKPCRN